MGTADAQKEEPANGSEPTNGSEESMPELKDQETVVVEKQAKTQVARSRRTKTTTTVSNTKNVSKSSAGPKSKATQRKKTLSKAEKELMKAEREKQRIEREKAREEQRLRKIERKVAMVVAAKAKEQEKILSVKQGAVPTSTLVDLPDDSDLSEREDLPPRPLPSSDHALYSLDLDDADIVTVLKVGDFLNVFSNFFGWEQFSTRDLVGGLMACNAARLRAGNLPTRACAVERKGVSRFEKVLHDISVVFLRLFLSREEDTTTKVTLKNWTEVLTDYLGRSEVRKALPLDPETRKQLQEDYTFVPAKDKIAILDYCCNMLLSYTEDIREVLEQREEKATETRADYRKDQRDVRQKELLRLMAEELKKEKEADTSGDAATAEKLQEEYDNRATRRSTRSARPKSSPEPELDEEELLKKFDGKVSQKLQDTARANVDQEWKELELDLKRELLLFRNRTHSFGRDRQGFYYWYFPSDSGRLWVQEVSKASVPAPEQYKLPYMFSSKKPGETESSVGDDTSPLSSPKPDGDASVSGPGKESINAKSESGDDSKPKPKEWTLHRIQDPMQPECRWRYYCHSQQVEDLITSLDVRGRREAELFRVLSEYKDVICGEMDNAAEEGTNNDDQCGICGLGGDLLCCDGCPAAFHVKCLGLEAVPEDDFFCELCQGAKLKEQEEKNKYLQDRAMRIAAAKADLERLKEKTRLAAEEELRLEEEEKKRKQAERNAERKAQQALEKAEAKKAMLEKMGKGSTLSATPGTASTDGQLTQQTLTSMLKPSKEKATKTKDARKRKAPSEPKKEGAQKRKREKSANGEPVKRKRKPKSSTSPGDEEPIPPESSFQPIVISDDENLPISKIAKKTAANTTREVAQELIDTDDEDFAISKLLSNPKPPPKKPRKPRAKKGDNKENESENVAASENAEGPKKPKTKRARKAEGGGEAGQSPKKKRRVPKAPTDQESKGADTPTKLSSDDKAGEHPKPVTPRVPRKGSSPGKSQSSVSEDRPATLSPSVAKASTLDHFFKPDPPAAASATATQEANVKETVPAAEVKEHSAPPKSTEDVSKGEECGSN